jgi:hypothetical protein
MTPHDIKHTLTAGTVSAVYPQESDESVLATVVPYLEINLSNLNEEMAKHATSYVYLAQFAAEAAGVLAETKNQVDNIKASKYIQYKTESQAMRSANTKSITDETAKCLAEQDAETQAAKQDMVQAKIDDTFWSHVMNAMQQRGFLLKELAAQNAQSRTDSTRLFSSQVKGELQGVLHKDGGVNPDRALRNSMMDGMLEALQRRDSR